MIAVLDASAALTIVLKKRGHVSLSEALTSCETVLAPDLYQSEVANALWKYVSYESLKREAAAELFEASLLLVDDFVSTGENNTEAFFEALRLKYPVYDMLYLTLARRNNAALISLDKKLIALAAKLGIALNMDANR